MSHLSLVTPNRHYIQCDLDEAFLDFILSRQAKLCSENTVRFYSFTLGKFVEWLFSQNISTPGEITTRLIRAYLAEYANRGCRDSYIHGHARAIKTFVRFLRAEEYIAEVLTFQMPSLSKKRLLVLSASEVELVIEACKTKRDKALVLLMVDSGLRRGEVCALKWRHINISNGVVLVERGKGGKARSVVIGVTTRRALLAYRRVIPHEDNDPLFQTKNGKRLTPMGLRSAFVRLSNKSGVHITPHSMRRTFASLSIRAGMNLLHLQGLLGHSSLEMTQRYVQMLDDDLVEAHRSHGPIDTFLNKQG